MKSSKVFRFIVHWCGSLTLHSHLSIVVVLVFHAHTLIYKPGLCLLPLVNCATGVSVPPTCSSG